MTSVHTLLPAVDGSERPRFRRVVGVHDQPKAVLAAERVAKRDHVAELPARIDVQQRERQRARVERLHGEPHHDRRVLADRVQHHRVLELGRHLADDVDALGLELLQMRQQVPAHAPCLRYPSDVSIARIEGTRLVHRRVPRVDGQRRVGRRLVGIRDAREVREQPRPGPRVEAFAVAGLAGLERCGHVHEKKAAQRLDHVPHLSAGRIVRSDERSRWQSLRGGRFPRRPTRCAGR